MKKKSRVQRVEEEMQQEVKMGGLLEEETPSHGGKKSLLETIPGL